jgi:hypothetical protein
MNAFSERDGICERQREKEGGIREGENRREVNGYKETHTGGDSAAKFLALQVSLWPSNSVYQGGIYLQKENKD